jgi:hypothetical protein
MLKSKAFICIRASEARDSGKFLRVADNSSTRSTLATAVAGLQAIVRLLAKAPGQVGQVSRISGAKRHQISLWSGR